MRTRKLLTELKYSTDSKLMELLCIYLLDHLFITKWHVLNHYDYKYNIRALIDQYIDDYDEFFYDFKPEIRKELRKLMFIDDPYVECKIFAFNIRDYREVAVYKAFGSKLTELQEIIKEAN
jgi:hypothetical protein